MNDETLKEIVVNQLKINPDLYNEDLGAGDIPEWDSLGHVNLLMAVENHFGISFDIADAIDIETISDLSDMISKYLTTKGS